MDTRVAILETNYNNMKVSFEKSFSKMDNQFEKIDNYFQKVFEWQEGHKNEHNLINNAIERFQESFTAMKESAKAQEDFNTKVKIGRKIANWTFALTFVANILLLIVNFYLLNSKGLL